MHDERLGRQAAALCVAVALLAGCGGSQPPISAPGAMALTSSIAQHALHGKSWMAPGAAKNSLLYVSTRDWNVYVFTYPGGKLVGTLTGFALPAGLCSDRSGNVWVANIGEFSGEGYLVEYAHGGTTPIATLTDPYESPAACSIDPATGNLAAGNCPDKECESNVAVYPHAQAPPTHYSTGPLWGPFQIAYDNAGNIFIAAQTGFYDHQIGWLPSGQSTFQVFKMEPHTHASHNVQWDGKYIAVAKVKGPIRRYEIVDGHGQAVGGAPLDDCCGFAEMWVQGSTLISAYRGDSVGFWKYLAGGAPKKTIALVNDVVGLTVSVAPSR